MTKSTNRYLKALIITFFVLVTMTAKANNDTEFTDYLNDLIKKNHFVGFVVLLDKPGQSLFEKAYGFSNLEEKIKTKTGDLYRIASATKPFIATVVIKLAIEQKINLDEPLSAYLDNKILDGIANAKVATIRQLLAMQSGIYDYTENPEYDVFVEQNPKHQWKAIDALQLAKGMPAEFKQGTTTRYSNTNYILLGLVIEKVSKQSLAEALKKQIFDPLKLNNSYLEMQQTIPKSITPGYTYAKRHYTNISKIDGGRGLADGGIVSNARDLNRFIRHLMTDDQFMPPKWRQQMLNFHLMPSRSVVQYGLGLIQFSDKDLKIIGHDGDDSGYQSMMVYFPQSDVSAIFLSNSNPPPLNQETFIQALHRYFSQVNNTDSKSK